MESMQYVRSEEQIESTESGAVDPTPLAGTWLNSNAETKGLVRVEVTNREGTPFVRAFGACEPSPCDWGEVRADAFSDNVASKEAMAFSAFYDFSFMESYLQGMVKKGVLVIANFTRFKDDSGRSNYFYREFFYLAGEDA